MFVVHRLRHRPITIDMVVDVVDGVVVDGNEEEEEEVYIEEEDDDEDSNKEDVTEAPEE